MAQRSQVPKFGNWENEENVPYTAYVDNARKGRSEMNPNDREDNTIYSPTNKPPVQPRVQKGPEAERSKHERFVGPDALRPKHERRLSRDDGDVRKPIDSPVRHDTAGRKGTIDSPHHRNGGTSITDSPKRGSRLSAGSDRSLEHSPLHPTRAGNKSGAVSSPLWERKGSSEGSHGLAPSTPGRSRLRSVTRGDETPDNSPAVPKFGGWDESDPSSAEGYTQIFNKVREEKHSEAGKAPIITTETYDFNGQKRYGNDNPKCCGCFPWSRK